MSTLGELLEVRDPRMEQLGVQIGKLYTDFGLPIDMAMDRLPHNKEEKLAILHGACRWFIEHKRKSGAGEPAIERQRKTNLKMVEDFITKGETGVY